MFLLIVGVLWSNSVEANSVTASKDCLTTQPCTNVMAASFTIIGNPKTIHWTANYTGLPSQGHRFFLTTHPTGGPMTNLAEIELTTAPGGQLSGSKLLPAGTYHISITYFLMGPGSYTIDYNPALLGDPHITTINGERYDFQAAGEFIVLRQTGGLEIQVRQTPVATKPACVSLNTAVAARVGNHRVTYEPNLSGIADSSGLQLRVDSTLVELGERGIDLGNRGRITRTNVAGGLRIDFPDGSYLLVTPGWWADQKKWYLNLDIVPTGGEGFGIAGTIGPDTWLPVLPDGSSMGPLPKTSHDRYVDLNQKFADAWRVTVASSLFDYASGTSTKTFTDRSWPSEFAPCDVPGTTPAEPIAENFARAICQGVKGGENVNCIYDVMVTGNPGFATTYTLSQSVVTDAVSVTIPPVSNPSRSIWILLGLLLGLLIALLIFMLWRKRTRP
jgi:hypothetical protein